MRQKVNFDVLENEGKITNLLREMDVKMTDVQKAITEGTKLHDELMLSQPNSVSYDKIQEVNAKLHAVASKARLHYGETQSVLEDISFRIELELNNAYEMDSMKYHGLKKLRTKTTNAKKQLRGYSINKMEELALTTIKKINRAAEKHFTTRRRVK